MTGIHSEMIMAPHAGNRIRLITRFNFLESVNDTSKVFFLLVSFTDSYAASKQQQSVLLLLSVAPGKLYLS